MTAKAPPKTATKTDEELLAELDQLGNDDVQQKAPTISKHKNKKSTGPSQEEQDLLAELDKLDTLAQARPPTSRPQTPRAAASMSTGRSSGEIANGTTTITTTDDKAPLTLLRKSQESSRSFHQQSSSTPAEITSENAAATTGTAASEKKAESSSGGGGGGGSWWGGLVATASAAVIQAQAMAKELQQHEEAQKWADQVKGNVGALRSYGKVVDKLLSLSLTRTIGGELRSMAIPTFSNILNTLAPPISSHEQLMIHITHDFIGYPSLDPLIYQTFSRVMAQVEGGELMVIQKGQESKQGKASNAPYRGSNTPGWNDGPWWRQSNETRDFGAISGLVEGTKLCRVSAESYANDYFAPVGGIEEATNSAARSVSESNPTRSSDIFLSIQAISYTADSHLFAGQTQTDETSAIAEPTTSENHLCFALYLYDPIHAITFHTISQAIPQRWTDWVNQTASSEENESSSSSNSLPEDIREIVNQGGVDAREWVSEWIEEVIALGVGILAQRYVAKRMGVGEGGLGRGKARDAAVEAGAGEAARAL